jgi:MtrB/PioB family decaheme-associated outer membrane protein
MTKKLISVLVSSLFVSAPALAQVAPVGQAPPVAQIGGWDTQGSISLGGIGVSKSDTKDASKLEEFRDLSDGVLSTFDLRARSGKQWFDAFGENIGRDDMYLSARGGIYDVFKARIYTDWLKHNFVFDARTPFAGAGTNTQTATFPQSNPATWFTTDIGYKRKDTSGFFEWQSFTPYYFRVDAGEVRYEGSKLGSGANGTSPGNGFTDLSFPVEYKVTNVGVEGGYNTPKMHLAVNWTYSKFSNDNETIKWNSPFFGNAIDTTYLPPDNKYQRIGANATFRQLPWDSTLAMRYTWSKTESSADLATTVLNGTSTAPIFSPTLPNVGTFNGKIENQTFTLALASSPVRQLDTRVWYNYYKRNNDSTEVIYSGPAVLCGGAPCEGLLFEYTKHNVGVDAYWRVARGQRIGAGYEYWDVDQNREDYDHHTDNILFLEYKNTVLDNLSARLKYTYLQRRSNFLRSNEGVDGNDPLFIERFVGRFDLANVNQNKIKLMVDWSPMPLLDFSLEAIWKDNDFRDVTLGRTKDRRDEIYASVSYGDPAKLRFTLFGDVENIKYDSFHRNVGAGSCFATPPAPSAGPNCFDPNTSTPPNAIAYNWSAVNKDKNWTIGAGLDWPAMDRLMVKASVLYYKTDGTADMASQGNFGNPLPINDFDTSETTSLNLKGIYDINKNWSVTAGYSYEKYSYSDIRFNGYQYTIPFPGVTTNTSQSYLNGYNAFTPYKANIYYLVGTYHF